MPRITPSTAPIAPSVHDSMPQAEVNRPDAAPADAADAHARSTRPPTSPSPTAPHQPAPPTPNTRRLCAKVSFLRHMDVPQDALKPIDLNASDPFTLDSVTQCIALQHKEGLPYIHAQMKSSLPDKTSVLHGADAEALLAFVLAPQEHVVGCNGWGLRYKATNPMNRADIADIYFYCFTSVTKPARFIGHMQAMEWDKRQSFVVKTLLGASKKEPQALHQAAALFRCGVGVSADASMARQLENKANALGDHSDARAAQAALLSAPDPHFVEDFINRGGEPNMLLGTGAGETALMYAVKSGYVPCIEMMLSKGGEPDLGWAEASTSNTTLLAQPLVAAVDTDKSEVLLACLRRSHMAWERSLENSPLLQRLWKHAHARGQSQIMETIQSWTGRMSQRGGRMLMRPPSQYKVPATVV